MMRVQAILTELVFEHSLRVRFKAETSNEEEANNNSETTTNSIAESEGNGSESTEGADARSEQSGSTAKDKGKSKASEPSPSPAPLSPPSTSESKKNNLVGKINTLVTVDLDNIINAKGFLVLCKLTHISLYMKNVLKFAYN